MASSPTIAAKTAGGEDPVADAGDRLGEPQPPEAAVVAQHLDRGRRRRTRARGALQQRREARGHDAVHRTKAPRISSRSPIENTLASGQSAGSAKMSPRNHSFGSATAPELTNSPVDLRDAGRSQRAGPGRHDAVVGRDRQRVERAAEADQPRAPESGGWRRGSRTAGRSSARCSAASSVGRRRGKTAQDQRSAASTRRRRPSGRRNDVRDAAQASAQQGDGGDAQREQPEEEHASRVSARARAALNPRARARATSPVSAMTRYERPSRLAQVAAV